MNTGGSEICVAALAAAALVRSTSIVALTSSTADASFSAVFLSTTPRALSTSSWMASAASESLRCAAIFSSSLACAAATALRAATTSSAALAAADLVALMSSSPLVTADLARAMSVSYCGGVSGRDQGKRRVSATDTGHREGLGRIEICPRADGVGRVSRTDLILALSACRASSAAVTADSAS